MLVDCPNCPAQYDVPDSKVRPNLRLRCSRCSTEWLASPPVAAVPALAAFDDDDDDRDAPAETRVPSFLVPGDRPAPQRMAPQRMAPQRMASGRGTPGHGVPERVASEPGGMMSAVARDPSLSMAWVVSLAILVGAGWAAVHWRAPIMQSWPPSTRAYAAIGLTEHARTPAAPPDEP